MIPSAFGTPVLNDADLIIEKYVSNLCCPVTTMTFVGEDILILQKNNGLVRLVQDGILQEKPALDVNVNAMGETGLLGITSVNSTVYLYFTAADKDGGKSLGNKIFKYDWDGSELINPVLLNELPSNDYHNSGVMVTGLDGTVYAAVGDTGRYGLLQNKHPEWVTDEDLVMRDNGVILQVDPPGPYYAMGIRNSFGLAIDPVTGILWASENGDDDFDEINMTFKKFNSGWIAIMGPATESELASLPGYEDYVYSDPEFSWEKVVAPTALEFAKFKETSKYDNSLFVGDCNTGNLYKFELNPDRNGFVFASPHLQDSVVGLDESLDEIIFGTGFGCITDIERGPDGFLYIVSLNDKIIYRIIPKAYGIADTDNDGGCLVATATYGSELAPQVQLLREIRDDKLLQTKSGESFMSSFNAIYYTFSPTVADWEREYPAFRELVKLTITPLVSSLSLLNYVDMDSETSVLGYGASLILLNIVMYFVAPAFMFVKFRNLIKS
jgi:glucose/arabinose dehydrogenase